MDRLIPRAFQGTHGSRELSTTPLVMHDDGALWSQVQAEAIGVFELLSHARLALNGAFAIEAKDDVGYQMTKYLPRPEIHGPSPERSLKLRHWIGVLPLLTIRNANEVAPLTAWKSCSS